MLCPAFVKTRINLSERNRQSDYQRQQQETEQDVAMAARMEAIVDNGLAVDVVGQRVVEAVGQGELYIFTHPNYRQVVQQRYQAIDEAFARAAHSPLLASVVDEEIVGFT